MLQGKEWGEFSCQGSLNMPDYFPLTVIDADLYKHKSPKVRRLSLCWNEKGDACCSSHLVYTIWNLKKKWDLFNLNSVTSHFHIKVLRAHFLRLHHFLFIYGRLDTICEWQGYFKFYLFSILLNFFILISSSL